MKNYLKASGYFQDFVNNLSNEMLLLYSFSGEFHSIKLHNFGKFLENLTADNYNILLSLKNCGFCDYSLRIDNVKTSQNIFRCIDVLLFNTTKNITLLNSIDERQPNFVEFELCFNKIKEYLEHKFDTLRSIKEELAFKQSFSFIECFSHHPFTL
eukprot:TRINITY_DN1138_c0_g1_i1.p1 TRINITY_DN1138_c0_g1~~TRINITY_DN1138_c0_g1_i1.p1  ORF type:complete len:155 (+),score=42.24 TRINITY_DN1138_c0_g1_i1:43-507(+)